MGVEDNVGVLDFGFDVRMGFDDEIQVEFRSYALGQGFALHAIVEG